MVTAVNQALPEIWFVLMIPSAAHLHFSPAKSTWTAKTYHGF
jgi:hypothetical protein